MGKYKPGYYAVQNGRKKGIYQTWELCKSQVDKYPNAKYKKFYNKQEAEDFVENKNRIVKINVNINKLQVWTDGSSFGNGSNDARAGVGIFWKDNDPKNLSERLPGTEQTNNRAEVYAVIRALEICDDEKKSLEIMTDSMYVINAINKWIKKWETNEWLTIKNQPVKNSDLLKRLKQLIDNRIGSVQLTFVKGHEGNYGNEQADKLSKEGSIKDKINLKKLFEIFY
jgi:ribonuclease HI